MIVINKRDRDILKYDNDLQDTTDLIIVNKLDIADGIKDMLIKSGLTWNQLQKMEVSRISEILNVDGYIAKLIAISIRKYSKSYNG